MFEITAPATDATADVFDWEPGGGSRTKKVGDATIIYGVSADSAEVISLRVAGTKRGNGAARAALTRFCQEADRHRKTLKIGASPLDKRTKLGRLVAFYQSLGFEVTGRRINPSGDPEMMREPR